jgi:hypothetical protein
LTGRFRIEIYIGQESWRERREGEREEKATSTVPAKSVLS